MRDRRPVFFNLTQISMPIGSIASILHRITGVLLALGIPYAIYLFDLSLQGPQGYAHAASLFDVLALKVLAILFIWALTYHLLAGVRHLLSDIDIGSHLHAARFTAWLVNGIAAFVAVLSIGAFF
jgi:succinate dehydrogenase / fumarate reductase cytochrome b subunit